MQHEDAAVNKRDEFFLVNGRFQKKKNKKFSGPFNTELIKHGYMYPLLGSTCNNSKQIPEE